MADDWLWRIRTSTLVWTWFGVVVAIGLAGWIYGGDNLQLIANTVNLLGAAVTCLGLLYAYAQASSDIAAWVQRQRGRLQRLRARITGRPLRVPKGQAVGAYGFDGFAVGRAPVPLDQSLNIDEQLAQLACLVDRLSANLANVEAEIHKLSRAIEQARKEARAGDAQTLAQAGELAGRFVDERKREEVLDLRVAIAGVAFWIVGAALTFCT